MADLMTLIHEAGFTGAAANTMYGIVMAESGGNTHSLNNNPNTRDLSYGLAQINMYQGLGPARLQEYGLHSYSDLFDPLTNLKVAYKMSGGGTHFGDWSTYNSGAYRQYVGQGGATVSNASPSSSGSTQLNSTGTTKDDLMGVDGLGHLLDTIPELSHLVSLAVSGNWTTAKFQNAIENTAWFRTHSDTVRSAIVQQANDPAAYHQRLVDTRALLDQLAGQAGWGLTKPQIVRIVTAAVMTGHEHDNAWITRQVGLEQNYWHLQSVDGLKGGMASAVQQLQSIASDYGVNWSPSQLARQAQSILDGTTTIDTYKQSAIKWAKSAFPSLAAQIDKGETVKDLSTPYVQSMSQLLEVSPGSLNLYTPAIRKALQGTADPKGQLASTPLWQFENQVRKDPRWATTSNANQSMASMAIQIGNAFGFNG